MVQESKRVSGVDHESVSSANISAMDNALNKDAVPMWFHLLPASEQKQRLADCHTAWDMLWFVHGLSFAMIDSPLFKQAIKKTKMCPTFAPVCRQTLASSHLDARNEDANMYKELRLTAGQEFGFLFTSDGWRNKARRSYHNYILVSSAGPIFLALNDVTGEAGDAKAIHDEFVELFATLSPDIVERIVIGCTDTPSSNVAAWKQLEATFPKQVWMGCMAHELSLMFKDWVKKVPEILGLYRKLKRITIWIKNHGSILVIFKAKVALNWPTDKRHWTILPYMPGDTRMATTFKLVHRCCLLKDVLSALVTDALYKQHAQAAIKGWNASQKPEGKIPSGADGLFPDAIADDVLSPATWNLCNEFKKASETSLYFLRMVDCNLPVLGKVYYTCALINKQLAILAASSSLAKQMLQIFKKRWARWHKDIHVLAYACDPSFQSHKLTAAEKAAVTRVLKRIRPDNYAEIKVELNTFKTERGNFTKKEWECVDKYHGYMWWSTFGDCLPLLMSVSCDILSKQTVASACEFNWSSVSSVERKGRLALQAATTNKSVNVAAMYHIEKGQVQAGVSNTLPTCDSIIEQIVNELEDDAPINQSLYLDSNVVPGFDSLSDLVEDSEEEEEEVDEAVAFQLAAAQELLYADWSTRDKLLSNLNKN